jgi:hypothetical protein
MIRIVALLLALAASTYIGALVFGTTRHQARTRDLLARLDKAQQPPAIVTYQPSELDGLPAPVQRYFRFSLQPGQPIVTRVRVRHEGAFAMNLDTDQWTPFTSDQHVVTNRPGFVWDARMPMAPGVSVSVIDAYVAGQGVLSPSVLGAFDITNMRGGGEVARGELMRYFAEAAWYPTALLPSQGVHWRAIDDASAEATLTDGNIVLTMRFAFTADGAIESVRAEARGFTKGDAIEMHPWEGHWSNYQERGGMRVPLTGEVAWLMPDGRKPYWRGTITDIAYTFANGAP